MKRIHYLLLGLGVSLCIAAVSPTTPPTRIIAGSGVTVVTNGVNNFTLSAAGGLSALNQNQFDGSSTNIKSGAVVTNMQVYATTNFLGTFISGGYPNRISLGAGTALSGNSAHIYQNGGTTGIDGYGGLIQFYPNGYSLDLLSGEVRARDSTFGFSVGGSVPDLKLKRNAAAVLEVNNGTAGSYGDVIARSVFSTNLYATNLVLSGGATVTKFLTATATLDFDLTAVVVQDLTITVTGAVSGNVVSIAVPNGSVTTTVQYSGWVSAADTVTVRARASAVGENPASGTFRATVIQ